MIQLPVSSTQKGFPRLGLTSSGSFNKWQGRFSRHFVIILKRKVTSGNKQKRHFVSSWHSPPRAKCVCRQIRAPKPATEVGVSERNYKHLHSKTHPDCLFQGSTVYFGCSSIHADGWLRRAGKITAEYHYLKAFADLDSAWRAASPPSPPPNRRTERWEQTRCLIRAEVSALEIWNAKSRAHPPPSTTPPKNLFSLSICPTIFSPLSRRPISRTVSLSLLSRKSAVSACLKVLRNFRKSRGK